MHSNFDVRNLVNLEGLILYTNMGVHHMPGRFVGIENLRNFEFLCLKSSNEGDGVICAGKKKCPISLDLRTLLVGELKVPQGTTSPLSSITCLKFDGLPELASLNGN
ncbi:hypothetical protein GOP47_0021169 [Adiantum capillus-veneris]|uniref:Uncharacterized protein n=1 Tax=Adiantum capillus-veneris TaxID=13818 RepID=A0A9D4UC68_ADICA|nr:hypothetical protein GOP47_0021169 [Adiantum capillus-veneris]